MSNYPKLAAELGDRYLEALAARQQRFLDYIAATRQLAALAPTFQPVAVPETVRELNAAGFEFASRLIEQQKQFVDQFVARAPVVSAASATRRSAATKPSRKAATAQRTSKKRTTKKAPAKRAASASAKRGASKKASSKKASSKKSSRRASTTSTQTS